MKVLVSPEMKKNSMSNAHNSHTKKEPARHVDWTSALGHA